jgi:hypothetical protein
MTRYSSHRFRTICGGCVLACFAIGAQLAFCEVRCPEIPTDPVIQEWKSRMTTFAGSLQGTLKYPAATELTKARTSSVEFSRELNSIPGIAGRGFNFLLVRHAGPQDLGAIEVASDEKRPFTCFARPGDEVQLRSSFGISHYTLLYKVDGEHERVELLDMWPEKFAFLESNSGGVYHGTLERSNGLSLVAMSFKEFDSVLFAIHALDYSSFADYLMSPRCNCISSEVSVQTIFDALLSSHYPLDLEVAVYNLDAWARSGAPIEKQRAYAVAALYIGPALNKELQTKEFLDGRVSVFRSAPAAAFFDPLSQTTKVALLSVCEAPREPNIDPRRGSGDNLLDPLTKSLLSSIDKDLQANRFSKVQQATIAWNRGHLMFGVDNVLAMERLNVIIPVFKSLQSELMTTLKASSLLDPEHGAAQLDLITVMENSISAHEDLLHLYVGSKDPVKAGDNFLQLVDLHAPLPWLIDDAHLACEEFNDPSGLEVVSHFKSETNNEETVRTALKSLSCFHDKSLGFLDEPEGTASSADHPAGGASTVSSDHQDSWLKGKWQVWDRRDGNCLDRGSLHMELAFEDATSRVKAGEFSASHLGGDSCIDFVQDRTFCKAVWSVVVLEYNSEKTILSGILNGDLSQCGDLVRSKTPSKIEIRVRNLGGGKVEVQPSLTDAWNPNWFRSKAETFKSAGP